MLLRFVVENLFCFAQEAVFPMVASNDTAHPEHCFANDSHRVLRASALYGANGHGKSKFLDAMALAKRLIVGGSKPDQRLPVEPFRLDPKLKNQPSRFEFTILVEDVEYTYGFVVDAYRVHEEWLFSRHKKDEVRLFERVTNEAGNTKIDFGENLAQEDPKDKEYLEFLKRGVRKNQLFLTKAVDDNFEQLKPVYRWFNKTLISSRHNSHVWPIALLADRNDKFRQFIGDYLHLADTGISGIHIKNEPISADLFFSDDPPQEFITHHHATDGSVVNFNIKDESTGTRRLIEMLSMLANPEDKEHVYILDELDRTLHPHLSRLVVETFLKNEKNKKCQLIFTTHESSLLNLDLLRRDEVWFVEKNAQGMVHLYPLNSFDEQLGFKIERGYLQGRFGAIPFIGDTSVLGW